MNAFDSSVLVAALVESELHHERCRECLMAAPFAVHAHALVETFNTLTGGRIKPRPSASLVARILKESIWPRATILSLDEGSIAQIFDEAESRGVRGGAIYDYLHLVAARQHGMERIYTLNTSHFKSFWREGDPELAHPETA